jgi:hypothetical protein
MTSSTTVSTPMRWDGDDQLKGGGEQGGTKEAAAIRVANIVA